MNKFFIISMLIFSSLLNVVNANELDAEGHIIRDADEVDPNDLAANHGEFVRDGVLLNHLYSLNTLFYGRNGINIQNINIISAFYTLIKQCSNNIVQNENVYNAFKEDIKSIAFDSVNLISNIINGQNIANQNMIIALFQSNEINQLKIRLNRLYSDINNLLNLNN